MPGTTTEWVESSRRLDRLSFRASVATLSGLALAGGLYAVCVSFPLPDVVWGVAIVSALLVFLLAGLASVVSLGRGHERSVGRWTVVVLARSWLLLGTSLLLTWGLAHAASPVLVDDPDYRAVAYGWPLRWVVERNSPMPDGPSLNPDVASQVYAWPFWADLYVVAAGLLALGLVVVRVWRRLELRSLLDEVPHRGDEDHAQPEVKLG